MNTVNHLTLKEAAAQFPVDSLAYLLLDDGTPEVSECIEHYREKLSGGTLRAYRMKSGAVLEGVSSYKTVPMIMSMINGFPISASELPADLKEFISYTEEMAEVMLSDSTSS